MGIDNCFKPIGFQRGLGEAIAVACGKDADTLSKEYRIEQME